MSEQIVIAGAGLPGKPNSYYSQENSLATTPGVGSPVTPGRKVIPDIGFILFEALPAGVNVQLKTATSTWVTVVAAGGPGASWSDGTNLFVEDTNLVASPPTAIKYFVISQKP